MRFPFRKNYKKSYSQCGEDLIVDFIFNALDIKKPSYLDIGAHDPTYLNNTYLFYEKGCRGVNVEPDPFLYNRFAAKRRNDVNLNIGIARETGSLDFYIMSSKTLNTFSAEEAKRYENYGRQKIEKVVKTEVRNVNEIIRSHFSPRPNFISLDIEGMEMEVLESLDFGKFSPEVFCVETLSYTEDKSERKLSEIAELICGKGFFVYADTYINTIFVDKKSWSGRK